MSCFFLTNVFIVPVWDNRFLSHLFILELVWILRLCLSQLLRVVGECLHICGLLVCEWPLCWCLILLFYPCIASFSIVFWWLYPISVMWSPHNRVLPHPLPHESLPCWLLILSSPLIKLGASLSKTSWIPLSFLEMLGWFFAWDLSIAECRLVFWCSLAMCSGL